jgi:hypothetical protein
MPIGASYKLGEKMWGSMVCKIIYGNLGMLFNV